MSESITNGYMIKFGNLIMLPQPFLQSLMEDGATAALIVYSKSAGMIRLLPVNVDSVVKVSVTLSHLSPSFLDAMTRLLADLKLNMLYTAGICFTENQCIYEGYLKLPEGGISEDTLLHKVKSIESVSDVIAERIECIL